MLRVLACSTTAVLGSASQPFQVETRPKHSVFDFPLASRVVVRRLSYSTTETSLRKRFSNIGKIEEVSLIRDKETKKSMGFAFIQYSSQEEAFLAIEHMDRTIVDGTRINVEIANLSKSEFPGYPIAVGPPTKVGSKMQSLNHETIDDAEVVG